MRPISISDRKTDERSLLREEREEARRRADIARKRFLDALAKAVLDDLKGRPAG